MLTIKLKFSNRHNSPPNGARESKIPPCDSELRTLSTCILRFFSKKIDLPTLFYHFKTTRNYEFSRKLTEIVIYVLQLNSDDERF